VKKEVAVMSIKAPETSIVEIRIRIPISKVAYL